VGRPVRDRSVFANAIWARRDGSDSTRQSRPEIVPGRAQAKSLGRQRISRWRHIDTTSRICAGRRLIALQRRPAGRFRRRGSRLATRADARLAAFRTIGSLMPRPWKRPTQRARTGLYGAMRPGGDRPRLLEWKRRLWPEVRHHGGLQPSRRFVHPKLLHGSFSGRSAKQLENRRGSSRYSRLRERRSMR
jgi:hypothetical protein